MKAKGITIAICVADAVLLGLSIFLSVKQDRTAPVISFVKSDLVYSEDMDESLLLEDVTASDDRDGDVSDSLLVEKIAVTAKGDVIVTYAAMDSSNNVSKASRVYQTKKNTFNRNQSKPDEEKP